MFFESTLQSRRFLMLATKAAGNTATREELDELRSMTRDNKDLEKELRAMRIETRQEADSEFTVLFLRVLFGTAKPAEVAQVQALPSTNPEQWVAFQHLRFALEELAQPSAPSAPEDSASSARLEQIREKVLSRLKSS